MTEPKAKLEAASGVTHKSETKSAPKPVLTPDATDDLKILPMAEVEKKLDASPEGLTQAEAQKRLKQYGPIGNYPIVLGIALMAVIIALGPHRGDAIPTRLQFALVVTVAPIAVAMPTVLSVAMAIWARLLANDFAARSFRALSVTRADADSQPERQNPDTD